MHTWNYRDNRDNKQNYRDRRISIIAQPYWLNKFYGFYMAAVVGIVSGRNVGIHTHRGN